MDYPGTQLEGGAGRGLPCPFSKIGKKLPSFWKKKPWLCPSRVKFLILNVVLRVSSRKKNIFSPCGAFLPCVVDEMFIDVPWFQENSPALKNSWLRACYPNSIFLKNFQRINGHKDNHSFIGCAKIHEYTADSCTANGSSWPWTVCSEYKNAILQNFMRRLIIAASKIMVTRG